MNRADGEAARGLLLPQVSPQGSRGFVRIILRAINIRAMVTRYRLTIKVKALFPLFPIEIARCRDRATFRCEKNPARRCDQSKDQETSVSRLMKRRKIRSSSSRGTVRRGSGVVDDSFPADFRAFDDCLTKRPRISR